MLIFLGVLIAVAVIAVFIWNYRRQAAAREAASAERMKAFLDAARATAPPGEAPAARGAPAAQPATTAQPAAASRVRPEVTGFSARSPFMSGEVAAWFDALKGALPEHEVFARVSLATFIAPADNLTGFAREAQERQLVDAVVDFLVCDTALKSVAVVQCGAKRGKAADTAAFAAACVQAAGLRWVQLESQPMPGRAELKRQVLGA